MRQPFYILVLTLAGLAVGNFLYYVGIKATPDYMKAIEVTYNHGWALAAAWMFWTWEPKQ